MKLLASGGVDEYEILALNPVADGYGVGTSIANAPVLNFALDIMEIEGKPMAKRGKWSGAKDVYRRRGTRETVVLPAGKRPSGDGPWEPLLKPLVSAGRIVRDLPPPRTIRDFVLDQLAPMPLETLRRQDSGATSSAGLCRSSRRSSPTPVRKWRSAVRPRPAPRSSAAAPTRPRRSTSRARCGPPPGRSG